MTAACGKASSTRLERVAGQLAVLIVVAESDDLGRLRAGRAQQVEPQCRRHNRPWSRTPRRRSIMLGFLSISVTPMRLAISICADGLAEAAVADDDRAGLGRLFRARRDPSRARSSRRSSQSISRIRNGVVAIDRVTTAPNSDAASGVISCARRRLREQHEAELAGLAEQQAEPDAARPAACRTTRPRPAMIRTALMTITASAMPDHEQRPRGDQRRGRAASRPRGRTGRAGSSGTARRRFRARAGRAIRRASRRRRTRRARPTGASACISAAAPIDREQAGDDEQLALAEAADQPEQRIEHAAGRRAPGRRSRATV